MIEKNKVNIALWILFILGFGLFAYICTLLFYPFKTIKYTDLPLPVLNKERQVSPGENVLVEVNYCRYFDEEVEVIAELVGETTTTLGFTKSKFPRSEFCPEKIVLARDIIPFGIPEGEYKIKYFVKVNLNPLRSESFEIETQEFKIINQE